MTYTGSCACGAVTVEIAGEPVAQRQCWCRQCQQVGAGGPTNNAMFKTDDVRLTGELGSNAYVAASGNTLSQWFCASCGTPVYSQSSARAHITTIRFGMLDAPHGLKPTTAIWTDEAPEWAIIDPEMEQFPQQAPAPTSTT